jgi:hypothetical protein
MLAANGNPQKTFDNGSEPGMRRKTKVSYATDAQTIQ